MRSIRKEVLVCDALSHNRRFPLDELAGGYRNPRARFSRTVVFALARCIVVIIAKLCTDQNNGRQKSKIELQKVRKLSRVYILVSLVIRTHGAAYQTPSSSQHQLLVLLQK